MLSRPLPSPPRAEQQVDIQGAGQSEQDAEGDGDRQLRRRMAGQRVGGVVQAGAVVAGLDLDE